MALCTDVVSNALNEAEQRLGGDHIRALPKLSILMEYCAALDSILLQFDGAHPSAEVFADGRIRVSANFPSVEITAEWDVFNELIERSESFSVRYAGNEEIALDFLFPSIWEQNGGM